MGLEQIAARIRLDILEMIHAAGSGHIGGALSAIELMVSLYFSALIHWQEFPWHPDRDRVIFSKGHASALLYACLAEAGYFPKEDLLTFRKLGSKLQGHPTYNGLPGVEVSTGSLGHGLSVGIGMALAFRQQDVQDKKRVYVLIGDGECDCGQIWEAAMSAAHYQLSNLCAILDNNNLQIDGTNTRIMDLHPLDQKWRKFGWNVIEIDGHDFEQILDAYAEAKKEHTKPTIIIAKTVKGKGILFMENEAQWHGKVPKGELYLRALKELQSHVGG